MKKIFVYLLASLSIQPVFCTNYYVDFNSGDDTNSGTSQEEAWQHCPGDENAESVPALIELQPRDIICFKGGVVYQGNITLYASGDSINHITYKGDGWGSEKAIIDGSMPITVWTALNDSIYYADIPDKFTIGETSSSLNLHKFNYSTNEDEFMYTSQTPNPADWYFNDDHEGFISVPNNNITLVSITDSAIFNQTDPNYWDNFSLLIWTNPNMVVLREILSFSPELRTVYFDSLHAEAIYPDGRDQGYAIYNSIHALDQPGEYYVNFEEERIYIYSKSTENLDSAMSISVREFGFNVYTANGITIEGFIIRKHSGDNLRAGIGIGCYTAAHETKNYYTIRNNYITHNCHPTGGYGGLYFSYLNHSLIENNEMVDNFRHRGIFCSNGTNVIVKENTITRSGSTSLTFYTMRNSQIIYNSVFESLGGHANGITLYLGSKDILIAGNKIIECASPMTFQDGGNLYFINNLIDSKYYNYGVNEWGRTSRGPWTYGEIVFLNNTFISLPDKSALNIENSLDTIYSKGDTIYPNSYISYNNIIDAGGGNQYTQRGYNLYTSLNWDQEARYDWYLQEGEFVEEDKTRIFEDPSESVYMILENGPAAAGGTDVSQFLPTNKFPDFNFNVDINGYPHPTHTPWSIGAYEYVSPTSILDKSPDSFTQRSFIYPNPTQGTIHICVDGNTFIKGYSMHGTLLFESSNKEISLESVPKGIYIIKILNDSGVIFTEKIMKY